MKNSNNAPLVEIDSGLGKRFVGSTMWIGAVQTGTYMLSFGANIILARLLAPEVFGIFALATSIQAIFYILGSWSFSVAVIQSDRIDQAFFDTAVVLSFGLGVILFFLAVAISYFLRTSYSPHVLQIFVVLAGLQIFTLLSGCFSATLHRELVYKKVSLVEIGANGVGLVVAIGLALSGFGVWSLVGKQIFQVTSRFMGTYLISPWRFRGGFELKRAKSLFKFGSQMFLSSGLETFLSNIQGILIGTILGTTALGYFDRAIKLSHMGNSVAGPAINQVSFAAYSRLQTSPAKIREAFDSINYFLVRIFALIGVLFFLIGDDFTVFLYGEKWQDAGKIVPFLSGYIVFMIFFDNVKHFLYSMAKIDAVIKVRSIQCVFLIVGLLLILPLYGLAGSALVITFMYLIGTVLALYFVKRFFDGDFGKMILHLFGPPLLAFSLVLIIRTSLFTNWNAMRNASDSLLINLLAQVVVAVVIYAGVLLILEGKRLLRDVGNLIQLTGLTSRKIF